jgi:hypothetical protein
VPSKANGTNKKLYVVPLKSPVKTYEVTGAVGSAVGVIVISVPTPAAGAFPFAEESVGVAVE